MGSFSLDSVGVQQNVGNLNHVFSDPQLLGLDGTIGKVKIQFLLDSGASCNFVSLRALNELGLEYDLTLSQNVKLADSTVLKTCGQVDLRVCFGQYTYFGRFYILDAKIPYILGMTFFKDVSPVVDWQLRTVVVYDKERRKIPLPVIKCAQSNLHVVSKPRPCTTLHLKNSFEGLQIDEQDDDVQCVDDVSQVVVLTSNDACTEEATQVQQSRVLVGKAIQKSPKCKKKCRRKQRNKSATKCDVSQKSAQCNTRVSEVLNGVVGVSESVGNSSENSFEVVPLK